MAIFPFLGGPRRPRTERGELNHLAGRILVDAFSGKPGQSIHTAISDERITFKMSIDGGPVVEFRGFDARGQAAFSVWFTENDPALVDLPPSVHVDPGLFSRRQPIRDRYGRPTMTEAEYVSQIAVRHEEVYRDVVGRGEGTLGRLTPSGKGVAALKASAFLGMCRGKSIGPEEWVRTAERTSLGPNPSEAAEVRRLIGEEMVAALEGRPLMTGTTAPLFRD